MIEVFARRPNAARAAALVAKLAAEGRPARGNNSAFFDATQLDKSVVMVYHDGEDARIPAAYDGLGIECALIPGHAPEGGVPKPVEKAPEPVESESAVYSVEQRGSWWTVVGPDGEKVGKSYREEEDAHEAVREMDAE